MSESASRSSTQISERPAPANAPTPKATAAAPGVERRLRLWPGIAILALQWGVVTALRLAYQGTQTDIMAMMFGPIVGTFAVFMWWSFASRLRWTDRLLIPGAYAASLGSILVIGHDSIGVFGIILYVLPIMTIAWIAGLVVTYPLSWPIRRAVVAVLFVVICGYYTLIRLDGVSGEFAANINWRWVPSTEQKFLAERTAPTPIAPATAATTLTLHEGDWPEFRGPKRDNRLTGVTIPTDWDKNPPRLLWKRKVGPGWGSFAVIGNRIYTQEQWNQTEVVVCYDGDTGKEHWFHEDKARFTEPVAGPGPRATPTFRDGKLYTMGAAGKLLCLDAADGHMIWEQNILVDSDAKLPQWGFASSPLIAQGVVMVFAGGPSKSVVGYDAGTGKILWASGEGKLSYASLQRAEIDGVEQALLATGDGLTAFLPKDGAVLWEHKWPLAGARCIQAAAVGDADFLIGTGFGNGTRRVRINHKDGQWEDKELWTTRAISGYFNDFVVHKNHNYGFNTELFACVDLDKGKLKWKERGYGCGQVLLLADQDLLLIVSEKGEAVLVEANPAGCKELARFQAIEGKTWNHPVLAHGRLYVRNGVEAACYQLLEPQEARRPGN
jgi:outer membrane protein assembly factor BamB